MTTGFELIGIDLQRRRHCGDRPDTGDFHKPAAYRVSFVLSCQPLLNFFQLRVQNILFGARGMLNSFLPVSALLDQ